MLSPLCARYRGIFAKLADENGYDRFFSIGTGRDPLCDPSEFVCHPGKRISSLDLRRKPRGRLASRRVRESVSILRIRLFRRVNIEMFSAVCMCVYVRVRRLLIRLTSKMFELLHSDISLCNSAPKVSSLSNYIFFFFSFFK